MMRALVTPWRAAIARPRTLAGLVVGGIAYPLLPRSLDALARSIIAWDIGVTLFLLLSLHLFLTEPLRDISAHAQAQEEGEWTVFALTLGAAAFSMAGVIGEFSATKAMDPTGRGMFVGLVGYTLFASWLMTHTTFGFRYAHEYYSRTGGARDLDGGLDFPHEDRPDYLDFMYFALVLGMTFQVSDVQITARKLRRLATLHGLVGFLFNTVILALTVNLAASML